MLSMRTSIDFPDPLMHALKAQALEKGVSLRALLLELIEKGLRQEPSGVSAPVQPPSLMANGPLAMSADELSNAALFARLDG
jgi:hypothetical protein